MIHASKNTKIPCSPSVSTYWVYAYSLREMDERKATGWRGSCFCIKCSKTQDEKVRINII